MQPKNHQQGFTLIELMVVVAIIGILAAIGLPAYADYVNRTKWATNIAEVGGLKMAIRQCLADNATAGTSCDTSTKLNAYGFVGSELPTPKYGTLVHLTGDLTSVTINFSGKPELNNLVYEANCTVDGGGNIVCKTTSNDQIGYYVKGSFR